MKVPNDILKLKAIFDKEGADLYLVGGCVRDSLLGLTPKDFDLVTNLPPKEVVRILKDEYIVDLVGAAFGVIMVYTETDSYEIATYRKDITEGRKPEVEFSTINEDVKRRDFTINAMFYDIKTGTLIDLVGGKEDLQNGIIRTVGDASLRFREDPLRKLRAVRFSTRFQFSLHEDILISIRNNPSLEGVSRERIVNEFLKASSYNPHKAFDMFYHLGLLGEILSVNLEEIDYDWVFEKIKWNNYLVCIFSHINKTPEYFSTIGFPNDLVKALRWYKTYKSFLDNPSAKLFYSLKRGFNEKNEWFVSIKDVVSPKFLSFDLVSYSQEAMEMGLVGKDINTLNENKNYEKYTIFCIS